MRVAVISQPSLQLKLKSDENGHALMAASDTISCFKDMFLLFSKTQITLITSIIFSLTFRFISKINYKNEN